MTDGSSALYRNSLEWNVTYVCFKDKHKDSLILEDRMYAVEICTFGTVGGNRLNNNYNNNNNENKNTNPDKWVEI